MFTISYCSNGEVTLSFRICKKLDLYKSCNKPWFEDEINKRIQSIEDLFTSFEILEEKGRENNA